MNEIPSVPGYFATRAGDIYSQRSGRFLTATLVNGYPSVRPTIDGKVKRRYVHRLVCEAYHGTCPPGLQASHIDGDSLNCQADNLCWETPRENTRRKYEHGTMNERHKVSPAAEQEIVEKLLAGVTQTEIAKDLGISQSTVSQYKLANSVESRSGNRKLSAEDEQKALELLDEGWSQASVGALFNVTQSCIYRLKERSQ